MGETQVMFRLPYPADEDILALLKRSIQGGVCLQTKNICLCVYLEEAAMPNHGQYRCLKQKGFVLLLALVLVIPLILAASHSSAPAENAPVTKANYELAAKWTSTKIEKLVFDTSVTPRWLESGDRFWYTYKTPQGRNFYLVDPVKKSRTLLFDNAKMAAMLTAITRMPWDSQNLPFDTIQRFVKKDTAFQFQFDVPADADIVTTKKADQQAQKTDQTEQTGQRGQIQGQRGQGRGAQGQAAAAPRTKTLYFEYDLTANKLQLLEDYKPPTPRPRWASVSPDGKTILFARNHNLYMMDDTNFEKAKKDQNDKSIVEIQLTTDGEEYYTFAGGGGRGGGDQEQQQQQQENITTEGQDQGRGRNARSSPIPISWAKDSKRFAVIRNDRRKVENLWVINTLAKPRPTLNTYRYAMPGEPNVPQDEMMAFDRDSKARVKIKADAFQDQNLSILTARRPPQFGDPTQDQPATTWFTDASDKIYFTRQSRDLHRLDVCVANPDTGEVKTLLEERLNTYIESKTPRLINNGQEFIWWSERDGWGHLYRYDLNGVLKNQITSGEFVCVAGGGGGRGGGGPVAGFDEKSGTVFFTAVGREPGEDPYYPHLYRVNLDGTGLKLLDPGDASHAVSMSESSKYFVDNSSRVNTVPRSVLYDSAGALLTDLETMDIKPLSEAGFKFPEPFKVKADDGVTNIYGVMYKPFDFDPLKKYPIILYVYPGPQTESVTKTFTRGNDRTTLAQFGFIVIEVGNRGGNPQRSKWYHNYGYGNLRDYGLADKKTAVEQLARRFSFIDVNKVGIYGHSGGGFMSAAAMLVYPDFFKVAWSESGNHENNIYNNTWSETHHGIKEVTDKDGKVTFEYSIDKNSELAKNLKGHLMLTTGDYDSNVHPANTMVLADALIRANKRFDMMIYPGKPHAYGDDGDYNNWIKYDYFCKWLIGDFDSSVDLVELAREKAQNNKETAGARGGRGRGGN
jgi:dipeptidyl-peptidase-4